MTVVPKTQYAKSGDVHIAYQVIGDGPVDLVFIPGFVSHVEQAWESPWAPVSLRPPNPVRYSSQVPSGTWLPARAFGSKIGVPMS